MSIAGHALAAAEIAASALAALTLWLAARRLVGRGRLAYLWFSAAAALWCLGAIAQQALGAPLSGVAAGLTLADLPSLLALVAVVVGVAMLVAVGGGKAGDGWRTLGQRMARRPVIPRLADGFVLAAVLFVIGWIALFGPDYIRSGSGPGAFAVELLHPPGWVRSRMQPAFSPLPTLCKIAAEEPNTPEATPLLNPESCSS